MMKHFVTKSLTALALLTVLLLSGGAASAHDQDGCKDHHDMGDHQHGMGWDKAGFIEQQKQLLHQTMKSVFEKDKPLLDQMHKLHHDLHDVVAADSFNPKAYLALKGKMEAVHARLAHDRADAFASIAGQFTAEQREMLMRHHHHHGGNDGHDGWQHHGDRDGGWHHHDWQQGQSGEAPPVTYNMPQSGSGQDQEYPPYSH